MTLTLKPSTRADLPFVLAAEQAEHAYHFVGQWSEEQHAQAIADENQEHLLLRSDGLPVGFVLTAGLADPHNSIELRRIVVTRPDCGLGRKTILLVLARAFSDHRAHRVWLDVKPHNTRARHLYSTLGFIEEGILRDALLDDGRYESLIVMSMLKPEWAARS